MTSSFRFPPLALALLALLAAAPLAGCGGDDGSSPYYPSGSGGADAGSGAGSPTGSGGGGGAPALADHLLITEYMVSTDPAEFVEIWNPTGAEVDLTDHYLSDTGIYHRISNGAAFVPAGSPGLDFLVRFPAGTRLAAGATLTLAAHPDFEVTHGFCADFTLNSAPTPCGVGGMTPPMLAPDNGALGAGAGLLTNDGEMLVLFTWSGTIGEPVKDVDYVVWGIWPDTLGSSEVVNKTEVMGYQPDTLPENQRPTVVPPSGQSSERCALETTELATGGNGITGHDETSEPLDETFVPTATPTPGALNPCLGAL